MAIIYWIIFGALVGWIASLLTGRAERVGCLSNILIGIVGALIGGFISWLLPGVEAGESAGQSFILALIGALILLSLTGMWSGRRAV